MLRSSFSPLLSLGNKSSAAPFAGAALQLIDLQKQHLALIIGEKQRRREIHVRQKKSNLFSGSQQERAKYVLKSQKKREQELATMRQLKEEFEKKQGFSLHANNEDENGNALQFNHDEDNEDLPDTQFLEKQQQAEEIKEEFLQKLEELRPLIHATRALKSSRLYTAPLYKALRYYKLYDDPLFLQLSAVLGALDKHSSTRKGNNFMLWGEEMSSMKGEGKSFMKKKSSSKSDIESRDDPDEDDRDFTNFGGLSSQNQNTMSRKRQLFNNDDEDDLDENSHPKFLLDDVDLDGIISGDLKSYHQQQQKRGNTSHFDDDEENQFENNNYKKSKKGYYSFPPIVEKNMDTIRAEQENTDDLDYNNSNTENYLLSSLSPVERRQAALDRVRSMNMPHQVSVHEPTEFPAPDPDQIARASKGSMVKDAGVKQRAMAHRGHWVLREKGIAATKNTSAMDPW